MAGVASVEGNEKAKAGRETRRRLTGDVGDRVPGWVYEIKHDRREGEEWLSRDQAAEAHHRANSNCGHYQKKFYAVESVIHLYPHRESS
jgi:hypothetical protein